MGAYITILKRSASSFGSDQCSNLAAAIAYNMVFALFPLAFVGIAVLGFLVGSSSAQQQVVDAITKFLPLGASGKDGLAKAIAGTSHAKGWLSLIAIVTALWSASGLFGTIRNALDSVWDVDRELPFLRAKFRDLTMTVVFGGLLLAALVSTGFLQGARTAGSHMPVLGPLLHLVAPAFIVINLGVPLALTFLAFLFLYKRSPHARLTWDDVWIAAVVAALFFTFGSNLLTFYITHLGGFNALAGTLGAGILFLVFVNYTAEVILFAAEFSKHRMLVRTGAVPASEPKTNAPSVPLQQKVKDMLIGLWVVEEPHHEQDLPYQPGRLDPVTNAPTNTKEEVLYNIAQSREDAWEAAARAGEAPKPHVQSPMLAYAPGYRQEVAQRERAAAGQRNGAQPERATGGEQAAVPFGFAGDLRADEYPVVEHHYENGSGGNFLWKGMGYAIALLLTLVVKWRERKAAKLAKAAKQQKDADRRVTRLILRH